MTPKHASRPPSDDAAGARRLPRLTRRRLVWGVVLLAVAAAVAWALRPRPVPVDVAQVTRGPLEVTVDEEGKTRVHERYTVSAPVAGTVLRIELEPGDEVRDGQTVAVLEPAAPPLLDVRARAQAEARVAAARAAVDRAAAQRDAARAQAAYAASERDRMRRLAADQVVSRDQMEEAETAARTAEGEADAAGAAEVAARQELAAARAALLGAGAAGADRQPVEVPAPTGGVVLRRLRESEAVVTAGEPLLELADPADLEVVSDLLSTDAVRVSPGDPVRIEQWGGGQPLSGVVRRVEPGGYTKVSALGVEEQRVDVVIAFTAPREAWQRLGDGYRVEVRVVVWHAADVLQVPAGALFRPGAGPAAGAVEAGSADPWAVFVVEDGRAVLRRVEVGHRGELAVQVVGGLAAGDTVVLHPGDTVTDDTRVTPRK